MNTRFKALWIVLNCKFDALRTEMTAKAKALCKKMTAKFKALRNETNPQSEDTSEARIDIVFKSILSHFRAIRRMLVVAIILEVVILALAVKVAFFKD